MRNLTRSPPSSRARTTYIQLYRKQQAGLPLRAWNLLSIRPRSRSPLTHADVLGRDRPEAGLISSFVPCCQPTPLTRLPDVPFSTLFLTANYKDIFIQHALCN
jgi:hypothetical protein